MKKLYSNIRIEPEDKDTLDDIADARQGKKKPRKPRVKYITMLKEAIKLLAEKYL